MARHHESCKSKGRMISEEDIKEYLVNKEAKKAVKKAIRVTKKLNMSATMTMLGCYANDSNPFGDTKLNEKFVWRKKVEKDVFRGRVTLADISVKAEKKRRAEQINEIEKLKKRRVERVVHKACKEEELMMLQRERSNVYENKEEEFLVDQSMIGAQIRLRQGRAKPIDILITYLNESNNDQYNNVKLLDEPNMIFKGLTAQELEDLYDEIKLRIGGLRNKANVEYWEALMVVCEWELGVARRKQQDNDNAEEGAPSDMHPSIETDVKILLQGKSHTDLLALQDQMESMMRSGEAKVVEYWEAVLRRLNIYKAKTRLKEIHANMVLKRHKSLPLQDHDNLIKSEEETKEELQDDATPVLDGSFSPRLILHGEHTEEDQERAIEPDEDNVMLEKKRLTVVEERRRRVKTEAMASSKPRDQQMQDDDVNVVGVMEEGDVLFGSAAEVNLDYPIGWHDKYRPRKPKYFNRFHTGYEWNKYNRTHYDHDNPPPKFVQGYKFHIFYPDLIDKTKTPNFSIEKDGENTETCILKFQAGPPYVDIAFRIVNKEWEHSHKKGFKCTFERGILQLYFNFKRYHSRR